ncbi:hypothetical protein VTO42DRAFT_7061 [Malbranchea cinnamomea]
MVPSDQDIWLLKGREVAVDKVGATPGWSESDTTSACQSRRGAPSSSLRDACDFDLLHRPARPNARPSLTKSASHFRETDVARRCRPRRAQREQVGFSSSHLALAVATALAACAGSRADGAAVSSSSANA